MSRRSFVGDRHPPPLMDLTTLTQRAMWNVTVAKISRGTVQCSITYIKEFEFGEDDPYKVKVGVNDGIFSREIFIHPEVVERKIGFSSREVTNALRASGTQRTEVKRRLKTFQRFLLDFEGTMVVEMGRPNPAPVAVEINHSHTAVDILRSNEGLDARTEEENLGGRWLFDLLFSNNFMSVIWFIIGTPCSFYAPQHLLKDVQKGILARIVSFLMVGGFLASAFAGLKYRRSDYLRLPPSKFGSKCLLIGMRSVITVAVSLTYKTSELSILGFTVLALALFSLTMIVQPVTDGGLLQFFAWMPFQVAHFDEEYANEVQSATQKKLQLEILLSRTA